MKELSKKLEWIVRLAIWSDAAIAAEIGFVGAHVIKDLHPTVVDELELFSVALGTKEERQGNRSFGFDKNLEPTVQKVLGFDFADARDAGTHGNNVVAEFDLRPTNLFGPKVCDELLRLAGISCHLEMKVDMLDPHFIGLGLVGAVARVDARKLSPETSDQQIISAADLAFEQLNELSERCEVTKDYSPFNEFIKRWEKGG